MFTWLRGFGSLEVGFFSLFLLLYLAYGFRLFLLSRHVKVRLRAVLYKFLLRFTYVLLIILAIMGPGIGRVESEVTENSLNVYLVFDTSSSMNADDVQPSRLEKARIEALKIVNSLYNSQFSVFLFNSNAALLSPLSFDRSNIQNAILSIDTHLLEGGGTDFNTILEFLAEKFESTEPSKKVIIFFTDGENFEPIENQKLKAFLDPSHYFIFAGIGSEKGGAIQEGLQKKLDAHGQIIRSKLDLAQLDELSRALKGRYYLLNDQINQSQQLIDELRNIKSLKTIDNLKSTESNKYLILLIVALILVIMDFLTTAKVLIF